VLYTFLKMLFHLSFRHHLLATNSLVLTGLHVEVIIAGEILL
jgi:hypothetical protein